MGQPPPSVDSFLTSLGNTTGAIEEPLFCRESDLAFASMPSPVTLQAVQALRQRLMPNVPVSFQSSPMLAGMAAQEELFAEECNLVFDYGAKHVVLYDELEHGEGKRSLDYTSCDFYQGKVRWPLVRSKSTNPEVRKLGLG